MSTPSTRAGTTIGRRIAIYGATGAGKTTLSRRLAEVMGLGVIELDGIRHEKGWDSTPNDLFRERVAADIARYSQGWVCDGNYSMVADIVAAAADTVIWLHLPWRTSFRRLLWRTVSRAWSQEPLYNPGGPHESWRISFFSKHSILWWSIHHHRAQVRNSRGRIAGLAPDVAVFELRSPEEVEALIARARQQAAAPPDQALTG